MSNLQQALETVAQSDDYKVLRRIKPRKEYSQLLPGEEFLNLLVLDTETTGLDLFKGNKVIEIGGVLIEVEKSSGRIGRVLAEVSMLEDPGRDLDPENQKVHQITNEDLKGKSFDDQRFESVCKRADLILCHNADFDRPFLEDRYPFLKNKVFTCSYKQLDWAAEGYETAKLTNIALKQGKFYEAHRALTDCYTLVDLLNEPFNRAGRMPLQIILEKAHRITYNIGALRADFAMKDVLKDEGFRWDPESKLWNQLCENNEDVRNTVRFLQEKVYLTKKPILLAVTKITPESRFSNRPGETVNQLLTYEETPSQTVHSDQPTTCLRSQETQNTLTQENKPTAVSNHSDSSRTNRTVDVKPSISVPPPPPLASSQTSENIVKKHTPPPLRKPPSGPGGF